MTRFKNCLFFGCILLAGLLAQPDSFGQDSLSDPVVTPESKTTTMNKLIDEAAEKLPFLRKRVMKRLLAVPSTREEIVDICALKLSENSALKAHTKTFNAAETFNSESFTGDTPIGIDPDIKKIIIDALMKLLPLLIQLFFKV